MFISDRNYTCNWFFILLKNKFIKKIASESRRCGTPRLGSRRAGTCLLPGAAALLLGLARGRPGPAPVVRRSRTGPESGVPAVIEPQPAHLAKPEVLPLRGAHREPAVDRRRIRQLHELVQDLRHASLLVENFTPCALIITIKTYFVNTGKIG